MKIQPVKIKKTKMPKSPTAPKATKTNSPLRKKPAPFKRTISSNTGALGSTSNY